ncbi:LysM peptidoglycan-binding domain-containing protein [Streptomyces sp. MA25(2023)]|uniref:LysM peptidoglycan-binding domain-containing protein n=1 Tax=Streptomyces sp. MA25(2023) TaxID=3055078 RepID=UPI0025AED781|nr:LysM peptidoglycan-binding domain-containing protein [Streptomyces sp. MA25(2023)]MDN3258099.1 LysM peptidoglycan-binding domain-containing protein [Streptomyces sp. MA25(2023)]
MRHAHASATTAGRPAGVIKAVVSLVVLAGALAGLPLLLAWASPVIWEATHDDLAHLLDRPDTGAAFLALLLVVGWAGWVQFAFCTVRELAAQLRGRTWRVPPGFGASQRAAAALIGSILVLLPTSSALASDAQAATTATAARLPGQTDTQQAAQPSPTQQAQPDSQTATATTSTASVHTVQAGESLWSIAEQELGDGEKWRQIAALNEGRTMADGQIFHANSFLRAGWQLQMPAGHAIEGGDRTQLTTRTAAEAETSSVHTVTVEEGDSLSKIAQETRGDNGQWPDLFDASRGKPQPEGLPAITDPDVIHPGQQITVPGQQNAETPPPSGEPDSQEHTPPPAQTPDNEQTPEGHTPEKPAPDSEQTPKEQTPDKPAPDTGQTPEKPAPDTGQTPEKPAPDTGQAPAPEGTPSSAPTTPGSPPAGQPHPERSPSATTPATPRPSAPNTTPSTPSSPSTPAQTPETPATSIDPAAPASVRADGPLNLRIVLGSGALLAAAVTGALALRRTLQRRRRKPGQTIALAGETSPAEAQLAAAAEPGGAARLDLALRTMAHQAARQEGGAGVPVLRAARIGARTIHVLPEDLSQELVAPFVSGEGGWWLLDADAVLLDEDAARDVPAPCPGLVTIGNTDKGELVLLNLARTSALLLDGNPVHITEVCTSLALELGMSPWAGDVEVVTVGFGAELPQLLPTTRIAHMRQPAHALRDLTERLLEAHQLPDHAHQPYLLLCASTLDADIAWELADVIDKAGGIPVTVVAPASTAAPHFPDAELLNASLSTPQPLETTGHHITIQRLEHAAYQQITTALKVAAQPAHEAEGVWQDVPGEPASVEQREQGDRSAAPGPVAAKPGDAAAQEAEAGGEVFPALLAAARPAGPAAGLPSSAPKSQTPGDDSPGTDTPAAGTRPSPGPGEESPDAEPTASAASTATKAADRTPDDPHAPQIRVLGPIEVTGVAATGHGPRLAQLATLLFFRPGRSAETLCTDMDPASPWHLSTLNARMQGLRRSLGNDPDGNPYVPRRKSGQDPYRLSPAVRCDWTHFLQLVERALPAGPAGLPDLEEALSLVRGRPFGGAPLPWAEPYQQEMTTRIIDVAHTVATYRTATGPHHDLNAARRAVTTGLDTDHTAELLYRDWIRLEHAAGNRHGLHTAITRVQHINRELDCSLEPETEQLINQLLNNTDRSAR